jgi:hypothetical protein
MLRALLFFKAIDGQARAVGLGFAAQSAEIIISALGHCPLARQMFAMGIHIR